MKKVLILTLLLIALTSVVFAADSRDTQYSPNEIYKILFTGIGKEELSQPTVELKFGENSASKIDEILKELPFKKSKIAQGKIEKYKYTQVDYDNFWTVYLSGVGDEWDQKLFAVTFSIKLKNQNVQEKDTSVFLKLKQMYGEYTTLSKFIYGENKFDPNLNYYIWEKNNVIITYRCNKTEKDSTLVVEMWDKTYFRQNEENGKYYILQY
ncbi:hypothetical protein [Propionispora vibrioides]|uniref:Bla regulator protein blaR1 n=1 Tax=Propionispora vibrioides TaxID=112903 RepID=A0A1H8XMQ1_9FIRM|nr:hypothetical protein [Propionispora vibrioides]SEP40992.1 hypothetical protein SAMN04490178_12611 [Propionispora vibrioides]